MTSRHALRTSSSLVLGAAALYLITVHLLLPRPWTLDERTAVQPKRSMVTMTPQGMPGDPINIGIVADQSDLLRAFHLADWSPADPVTLRTSISIGASVLFDKPDPTAPISSLFFEGRRQDFAFEKVADPSAGRRHHLRLWLTPDKVEDGRPLWLGSASFDRGVGFIRDAGQLTQSIAADLDAERARVMEDLKAAGVLQSTYEIDGVGATEDGRNGGGSRYVTDGKAVVAIIAD